MTGNCVFWDMWPEQTASQKICSLVQFLAKEDVKGVKREGHCIADISMADLLRLAQNRSQWRRFVKSASEVLMCY